MRGFSQSALTTLIGLALVVLLAYLAFVGIPTQVKIVQQPAAPTAAPAAEEKVQVELWDLLVTLADEEGVPVYDANIYLLYEKPANIYRVPSTGIYKSAIDVNESYTFEKIRTGRSYYVLATAEGYYNAGVDVNMPSEIDKTTAELGQPIAVEITMAHKGTILGVQVPLTYRGSSPDIAKLVYDEQADAYKTEFQWVVDNTGEVRYNKIRVDLNTDTLGTATLSEVTITVGDQEFDISDITTSKIIELDDIQTIPKAGTLTVDMTVKGDGLDAVSGPLFTITLYDVQEGEYTATVEGPA